MFLFRKSKAPIKTDIQIEEPNLNDYVLTNENSTTSIDTDANAKTDTKAKTKSHTINISCCNKTIDIDKFYNMFLCPNCNSQLNFYIESTYNNKYTDTIYNKENDSNSETDSNAESNTDSNNTVIKVKLNNKEIDMNNINQSHNEIEIFLPVVIIGISAFIALQGYRAVCP
jgi:hypothetical protein